MISCIIVVGGAAVTWHVEHIQLFCFVLKLQWTCCPRRIVLCQCCIVVFQDRQTCRGMQHTRIETQQLSATLQVVFCRWRPRNILVHHQLVVVAKFPIVELITAFYYIIKRHSVFFLLSALLWLPLPNLSSGPPCSLLALRFCLQMKQFVKKKKKEFSPPFPNAKLEMVHHPKVMRT